MDGDGQPLAALDSPMCEQEVEMSADLHPESQRVGSTDASTQDGETNRDGAMPPVLPVSVYEFGGSRDGAEFQEKDSTHLANRANKELETLRERVVTC